MGLLVGAYLVEVDVSGGRVCSGVLRPSMCLHLAQAQAKLVSLDSVFVFDVRSQVDAPHT